MPRRAAREIEPMMAFAHGRGFGLTLIEGMPLGEVGIDRVESYLPLKEPQAPLQPASRSFSRLHSKTRMTMLATTSRRRCERNRSTTTRRWSPAFSKR